jgi:hypothetical protein
MSRRRKAMFTLGLSMLFYRGRHRKLAEAAA